MYNGYFSAEGTFSTEEAAAGKDTDSVSVAVPTSDAVAGDEIPVKPKVSDSSAGIPGESDVDESSVGSLELLRRTLWVTTSMMAGRCSGHLGLRSGTWAMPIAPSAWSTA